MGLLLRIHTAIYAWFVKWYRTRYIVRVYAAAHRQELRQTHIANWPITLARQAKEIEAIRAGKLDQAAVERKSWAWPFLPASVNRLSTPIIKSTPYNLRRMSRTPVPRRAINLIKGAVICQPWDVRAIDGMDPIDNEDDKAQKERIHIARKMFAHPNGQDSFQTYVEQGLEDMLILGAFCAELQLSFDPERPLQSWPVNVESIRIFAAWGENTPDLPHYAQMTGLKGERGAILFYDDELLYVKDNPSTDNPFGLGKMEVAFQSVNDFLGVQGMAGRAGSDQIHKTFLWWEAPQNEANYQIVRRHIQNELEGQAKLSIVGGMKKPEVVEVSPVVEADLLLNWQELLIRMIANGFDMSAMALGVEHDVNRAVGEVLDDKDFRSAVVPIAKRLQEAFTRRILHNKLGWYDLEHVFLNLDDPDAQTKMEMYSRMYSMNSITPNQIRKGMNLPPLDNPFADLTQFECMLLNIQAMEMSQNNLADASMQRQLSVIQSMPPEPEPPPQKQLPPGKQQKALPPASNQQQKPQQGLEKVTPGSASRGGQPPSPKPLGLPKFPIAGSIYPARKIAVMPINQVQDVYKASGLRPSEFLRAMDEQEPGILQTLVDEVKDFLDEQLRQELDQPKRKIPPVLLKKWAKELATRTRAQRKRSSDYTEYMYKLGQKLGRPGMRNDPKKAGKPGYINPTLKS